ncbi:hypothetical protein PYW08_006113 [Mythimna loreyi]|uniref:Uncharacterized protein n=1 Tax=Mythimna loreyi TaxID=667449 RepID=A0ACC2QRV8_9NEOP|nr:hypothetical protein PYW08_006113 [Mythimna loreyi]
MGYLADNGILPAETMDTADFIIFMDNLFDSLNGSMKNSNDRATFGIIEPVLFEEVVPLHQTHYDAETPLYSVESVEEIRQTLAPTAEVSEDMRRLEQNLHPLLVYRPEDTCTEMWNGPWPASAAQVAEPPAHTSVWLEWLQEHVDYGEPW